MSRWKIDYYAERQFSPLSYWVHAGIGEKDRHYVQCSQYDPPFPAKDPLKGFPFLIVSVSGFAFEFASLPELDHCIDILGQKNLSSTAALVAKRGGGYGLNSHWLSRLPAKLKPWSKREKIVEALQKVKAEIEYKKIKF